MWGPAPRTPLCPLCSYPSQRLEKWKDLPSLSSVLCYCSAAVAGDWVFPFPHFPLHPLFLPDPRAPHSPVTEGHTASRGMRLSISGVWWGCRSWRWWLMAAVNDFKAVRSAPPLLWGLSPSKQPWKCNMMLAPGFERNKTSGQMKSGSKLERNQILFSSLCSLLCSVRTGLLSFEGTCLLSLNPRKGGCLRDQGRGQ